MWESEERVLWNIKKLGMGIECLLNRLLADMGLTASRGLVLLFVPLRSTRHLGLPGQAWPGLRLKIKNKERTAEYEDYFRTDQTV